MTPRLFALACLLLLSAAAAGCFGSERAVVPDTYLTGGWKETDSGGGQRWLGLAAEWAHVTYQVSPSRSGTLDDGPYPASLQVMTIDTPGRLDREEVAAKLEEQVLENAQAQGVEIDTGSKVQGERNLASGVRSLFFTYHARIGSGSALFDAGREARVIGEVWYDESARVTVLTVGLAQIQGGGATGGYFVDRTHWEKMVADPRGSIEGANGEDGLIYNIRMERT